MNGILKSVYLGISGVMKIMVSMVSLIDLQKAENYTFFVGITIFIFTMIWVFFPYLEYFNNLRENENTCNVPSKSKSRKVKWK